MNNLNFLHPSSLALISYLHITFSQLFIEGSTNLFNLYTTNKLHEHSHTGIKITFITLSQYYYIPYLEKWLSIFIHDCNECHCNKHFNLKIQTAPHNSFPIILRLSTTAFLWIQKDQKTLLHTTNPIFML